MNGIISDTHCHNYSQFAVINADGVNSRLQIILDEIKRAAIEVKANGGDKLYHCGDLFHVRGNIAPSVLNPTLKCFEEIIDMGIVPIILCGNHDAEFKTTTDLGSAIESLSKIGCTVVNRLTMIDDVLLCPWHADTEALLKDIDEYVSVLEKKPTKLMMHASLNGVFAHIKGSEIIDPKKLFERFPNFKRVYAGHLHKHDLVYDDGERKAFSVGSICHHNWGDIGHRAGFILFDDTREEFYASNAPEFIEMIDGESFDALGLRCSGNYLRAKVEMTDAEVKTFRNALERFEPAGVTIICHTPVEARADRLIVSSSESLDVVISRYINDRIDADKAFKAKVQEKANEIMRGLE